VILPCPSADETPVWSSGASPVTEATAVLWAAPRRTPASERGIDVPDSGAKDRGSALSAAAKGRLKRWAGADSACVPTEGTWESRAANGVRVDFNGRRKDYARSRTAADAVRAGTKRAERVATGLAMRGMGAVHRRPQGKRRGALARFRAAKDAPLSLRAKARKWADIGKSDRPRQRLARPRRGRSCRRLLRYNPTMCSPALTRAKARKGKFSARCCARRGAARAGVLEPVGLKPTTGGLWGEARQ